MAGGASSTPLRLVSASTCGQFVAQVHRGLIDPARLNPRLRQDTAELDHVGVSKVVQVSPHHRFRNVQHPYQGISNSHQDVILRALVRSARMWP